MDILVIAIYAVICGVDSWLDIELFGKSKLDWLKTFLDLPNGIPSHDTLGRVFAAINPEEFEGSFMEWVRAINELTHGQVIAIDGKQLRGLLSILDQLHLISDNSKNSFMRHLGCLKVAKFIH
jgi:hypothetical protein